MSTNPTPIYTPGLGLSVHRLRTSPTALGRLAAAFGVLGCVTLGGACSAPEPERQRVYRYETDLDRSVAREAQDVAAASDAYARGWTRLREEDFRGAAAEFTRASELDPASGRAFNNAGWAYYKLGETYRAAFAFKQAVERMPGDAVPLSNLGLTMEEAGRLDEAVRLHEAAAAAAPDRPLYLARATRAKLERGDDWSTLADTVEELAFSIDDAEWVAWAQRRLAENQNQSQNQDRDRDRNQSRGDTNRGDTR